MKDPAAFFSEPFPEWHGRVRAAFTTRRAQTRGSAYPPPAKGAAYADLNLGFHCGDDPSRVKQNWLSVLARSGLQGRPLVIPRMTHGDTLVDADALDQGYEEPNRADENPHPLVLLEPDSADAVCAGTSRHVLAVTMADCLTALVFDPECGTIAAVHAGWRGTRARILEKSLRFLADSGRIRPDSTLVALGPCLRAEKLEVGSEVAAQLPGDFLISKDGRHYFDMPACNRAQAMACGIKPDHIRDQSACTHSDPESYFSYRRDGPASGRMAAFISLM